MKTLQRSSMHQYQDVAVEFIRDKRRCISMLDLGLGKSISTATAVLDLLNGFQANRVLIVAPKMVSQFSWPSEFRKWQHLNHLSITTRDELVAVKKDSDPRYAHTKRVNRKQREILKEDPHNEVAGKLFRQTTTWLRNFHRDKIERLITDVTIVNVDVFSWLVETMRSRWSWDTVIVDESGAFKTHDSGRFRAFERAMPYIDNVILLTATPAPNGYLNLWSQVYMVDAGERLGSSFTAYRDNYFETDYSGFKYVLRKGMKAIIDAKIADICIAIGAGDELDLHDEVFEDIILDLPPKLRATYDELEKEFYLSLPEGDVDVETMAILSNKLRQFCSGSVFASDEDRTVLQVHNLKVNALKDIVEATGERPIIVGYGYIPERDKIIKAFGGEPTVMTSKTFDQVQWDQGNVPMLVAHPASMGHGVSLQEATNLMVWFTLPWNLEHYLQFMGRINPVRQAQSGFNRPSIYYRIYFRDTIEERVIEALADKRQTQDGLLEAIRNSRPT